ncbi:G patch domain-containing protein 3 [Petromyzon marinus]|uniref:G patch domain-containing protein 3 n=1 Tax=Petromyzon marinus TaxID=7757 RepID=A0AAJ7U6V9_PETMA|nr:G patch domain-containing protein 3 [Petromyzon marinus]
MAASTVGDGSALVVIANIPGAFRAADLRNFFSQLVESGAFHCFHYRHRPERAEPRPCPETEASGDAEGTQCPGVQGPGTSARTGEEGAGTRGSVEGPGTLTREGRPETQAEGGRPGTGSLATAPGPRRRSSCCCVVRVRAGRLGELLASYSGRHWVDAAGDPIPSRCLVRRVRGAPEPECGASKSSLFPYAVHRRRQGAAPAEVTGSDLLLLPELNPPCLMPQGNVGTPLGTFMQLIRSCRLPPRIIARLGLSFPKTGSSRRYGNVPYSYALGSTVRVADSVLTGTGAEIAPGGATLPPPSPSSGLQGERTGESQQGESQQGEQQQGERRGSEAGGRTGKERMGGRSLRRRKTELPSEDEEPEDEEESHSDDDDDSCEEWERHEALHEDVTRQGRCDERLYEEEIELKWEKGGSGLVFYTDAQLWKEAEGDFDAQTSDDWDVDMSAYYDKDGGDMDARDFVTLREEGRRRRGLDDSAELEARIGGFERHTRGFGRRLLERQGWRDGLGLGGSRSGMAQALEGDGQNPKCRHGLGYRGEKLQRFSLVPKRRRRSGEDDTDAVVISTVYDAPLARDQPSSLLRRRGHGRLKLRDGGDAGRRGAT